MAVNVYKKTPPPVPLNVTPTSMDHVDETTMTVLHEERDLFICQTIVDGEAWYAVVDCEGDMMSVRNCVMTRDLVKATLMFEIVKRFDFE
jgi:hypothetical protein